MTISKEEILLLHYELIKLFGGSAGVRDMSFLESAIARADQTFDGKPLYETSFEKAAALGESIIMNHPFVDGNKRIGLVVIETTLLLDGKMIAAPDEKIYDFIINITTGQMRFNEIVSWLKENTSRI